MTTDDGMTLTETPSATIARQAAEIERLRGIEAARDAEIKALRDTITPLIEDNERLRGLLIRIGKRRRALAKLVCGEWVPFGTNEALDAIERCVREALGE
jgi:hypothetical protein